MGLNQRAILDAAVRITQRDGLWALSVRGLARELDVWPTAVQYHIHSKDQLIGLLVERLGGEVVRPPREGPWDERLRAYAYGIRVSLTAYPGIAEYLLTRGPAGPNGLRLSEAALEILTDAGLAEADTVHALTDLNLSVIGAVHRQQRPSAASAGPTDAEQRAAMARLMESVPPGALPLMERAAPALAALDPDVHFAWQIDRFVEGVRALAGSGARHDHRAFTQMTAHRRGAPR